MSKQAFHFKCYIASLFILCLVIFSACENPADSDTKPEPEKPATSVKFTNLEQFRVTVYRDSLQQQEVTEVAANGSAEVAAAPSAGTVFYPTFHLNIFDVPDVSIPYNGPGIITQIKADTTNPVNIPKLTFIQIDSAFIRITNNSVSSLTLRRGNSEESTLGFDSTVVNSGQTAVYQIAPGPSSGCSIMHNTITPVAFPATLTEFKRGIIYVFTYNGTSLTLTEERSVLQTIPPSMPENIRAKMTEDNSVWITWDAVYGATSYRIYRATSVEGTYDSVGTSVTASYTDTSLSVGQAYYYKISALSGTNRESAQSTAVTAVMPSNVPGSSLAEKLAWLQTNAVSGLDYTVEVTVDESISPTTLSYYNRSNIGITLKGTGAIRIIGLSSNGAMFTVGNSVTLVLDNNITLQGRSGNNNSLIRVNAGGTLVMNEGSTVTNNIVTSSYGGGVLVNGTFTMNGGTVSGNTSSSGGGVYVGGGTNSTFTMNGGTISGNSSSYGGGVLVSGTFTMNGGTVSGNTSSSGGGVYVDREYVSGIGYVIGTLTMSEGTVSGNTASNSGGGVHVNNGTFTMSGGTVLGNTASGGGGVCAWENGTFTMSGGTISGNSSSSYYGGGVYVYRGIFSKTNGTIYGYSAGDTVNSNTVKNSSGTIVNDWGHAAIASVSASSFKRKETTAGPGANLSWNYNNGSPVFSGEWETDPPGTEGNPFPLTVNTWVNDSIASTASDSALWYSFNVTSGTSYYVWWNDSNAGNNTKTLNVKVSAYYSNGTSIFTGIDSGWTTARSFTASSSGTVKIKVEPLSSGSTGTFAVAYSTGNTRPDGNIPSIPTGVTATTVSSSITVSWSSVSEAAGYYIYRSSSASGTYNSVGSSSSTSYSDTGLSANTAYYYKVSAYNSYGESAQSSYVSRTTAPDTPTEVTATATSLSSITVSWPLVSGATSYYVYQSTSASGTYSSLGSSSSTSVSCTGLSAGTTYYYKVSAYNSYGESEQSSYASATTPAIAPSTPTGVTARATSPYIITVNWSSVPGATGYYVYYSTSASGTYSSLATSSSTSISYTGFSANTTYYFKVSAYNSYGESAQSGYVSATTPASTSLTAGTWANGSITASSSVVWYSFSVTSGTLYYVWWNDSYSGNGTKTGDIMVSAYYSNGANIFFMEDSGWANARLFLANTSGTVTIKVEPYDYGTFAIAYRANNSTRP